MPLHLDGFISSPPIALGILPYLATDRPWGSARWAPAIAPGQCSSHTGIELDATAAVAGLRAAVWLFKGEWAIAGTFPTAQPIEFEVVRCTW